MKVIDLLNKIANGEEVPKKILLMGTILTYDEDLKTYIDEIEREPIDRIFNLWVVFKDKVEIIEDTPKEDNKKIEKISLDDYVEFTTSGDMQRIDYMFNKNTSTFVDKINEIIDKINVGE